MLVSLYFYLTVTKSQCRKIQANVAVEIERSVYLNRYTITSKKTRLVEHLSLRNTIFRVRQGWLDQRLKPRFLPMNSFTER